MAGLRKWFGGFSKLEVGVAIALAVGGFMGWISLLGFNTSSENKLLDFRFMLREPREPLPTDKVMLVLIDDQSLSRLNLRWPWPRDLYAKAIDRLSRAGARVVAFDLIFSEESGKTRENQDQALKQAIERSRSWVVLGSKFYTKKTDAAVEIAYVPAIRSLDEGKTHVGYVDFWADPDGVKRHSALLKKHQGKLYQSFALKILSRYYNLDQPAIELSDRWLYYGPLKIAVEAGANLLINYRGGPGHFKSISFENLLDDEIYPGLLESGLFKDKIILIGPTFTEAQDNHTTPFFTEGGLMSGVEIHANILDTVLGHCYYTRLTGGWSLALFLLLTGLLALVNIRLRSLRALGFLGALVVGYAAAAIFVFLRFSYILPLINPLIAMFLTQLVIGGYQLLSEERNSRQIKQIFSRYLSPKVVEQLVKNPSVELKLGGDKQRITVLFSDIRGFTTLSEQLPPENVVELLNEYFQTMTDVIFRFDGMVDKFIGDAIMAIFGAPVPRPDDASRAVRTALAMREAMETLKAKWAREGKRGFAIGVGVNTGEAIVGNMGSRQHMGYTAIGDTVNLASRLESKNKDLGTMILISESTYESVKENVEVKEYREITVKGKARAFSVYEVLGWKDSAQNAKKD